LRHFSDAGGAGDLVACRRRKSTSPPLSNTGTRKELARYLCADSPPQGPFYYPKIDFAAFVVLAAMEFALASSDPVDMPLVADEKEESNFCKLPC